MAAAGNIDQDQNQQESHLTLPKHQEENKAPSTTDRSSRYSIPISLLYPGIEIEAQKHQQ